MGYDGFEKQHASPTLSAEAIGFPTTCVNSTTYASVILEAPDPEDWAGKAVQGEPEYTYVLEVSGDFALLSDASITLDEHDSVQIAMSFSPSVAGTREGMLTVYDDGEVVLEAALAGVALSGDGPYWTTPTALDFGTLAVGEGLSGTAVLRLPSIDAGSSASLDVTVSGGGFSSSVQGAHSLDNGGTLTLLLTFSPGAAQSYSGTVSIEWARDDERGTLDLSLSGVGVRDAEEQGDAPAGANEATDTDSVSATRAVLNVPTYGSLLALGSPYVHDSATVSQPGFSATTTRHLFFRAEKSATVQATGFVWLQSNEDSVYALSKGRSYYIAGKHLYLGGGAYVGLLAGFAGDPVDASDSRSNANPNRPSAVEPLEDAAIVNGLGWAAVALTSTIVSTIHDHHMQAWLKPKGFEKVTGTAGLLASYASAVSGVGMFAWTYASYAHDYAKDGHPTFLKSLDVFSQAGLLMGTPSVITMYGAVSTTYASPSTTLLGVVALAIEGGVLCSVDSVYGQTAVSAGTTFSMRCLAELIIASRLGTAGFYGADIEIGGVVVDDRQQPTTSIAVDALFEVKAASAMGNVAVTASPAPFLGALAATAGFSAKLHSDASAKVYTVAGYTIECTVSGVTISGPVGPLVSLTPAMITLGAAAGPIKLTPALTDVGNGAIAITPAGITTMAGRLDLM